MTQIKNIDDFYHKIYLEPCQEFEEVRELCLQENNWLRDLYLPENLKIENHHGYCVVYQKESHEPVGMAGVFNDGRYPSNVARHLHREYSFPKFRQNSRQGVEDLLTLYKNHILYPLNQINNFDIYFLAMQNRYKKHTKGYWKVFSEAATKVAPEWKIGNNYIQTCPHNVQKCWQNFIYCEMVPDSFDKWDKKLITHSEWEMLPMGN